MSRIVLHLPEKQLATSQHKINDNGLAESMLCCCTRHHSEFYMPKINFHMCLPAVCVLRMDASTKVSLQDFEVLKLRLWKKISCESLKYSRRTTWELFLGERCSGGAEMERNYAEIFDWLLHMGNQWCSCWVIWKQDQTLTLFYWSNCMIQWKKLWTKWKNLILISKVWVQQLVLDFMLDPAFSLLLQCKEENRNLTWELDIPSDSSLGKG